MKTAIETTSRITCPLCGHSAVETMPTDACLFFYECTGCGELLKPKPGDCCVFCSYGTVPCPPMQTAGACCGERSRVTEPAKPVAVAQEQQRAADWTRQPVGAVVGWVLPIAMGLSANLLPTSLKSEGVMAFIWAAALAWMGVACLLNARRCHRLHCYLAAPVFLIGAVLVALLGLGAISFGPHGLNNVASGSLLLALLTYLPERMFGRYTSR